MADTETELVYPENAPIVIGNPDDSKPILVKASGYGYGFRKDQVGYITGDGAKEALDNRFFSRKTGGDESTGVPALTEPGTQRFGETVPELGIVNQFGGGRAQVDALTADVSDDPDGRREAKGPASIHDEQSDRLAGTTHRRTVDESTAESDALVEGATAADRARQAEQEQAQAAERALAARRTSRARAVDKAKAEDD